MDIRAHHLLCLLGFRGAGYSPEFIENMKKVAQATFFDNASLRLTSDCDVICAACPHLKHGECRKRDDAAPRVRDHDLRVADTIGVRLGAVTTWQEVRQLMARRLTPASLALTCPKCEWLKLGYCAEAIGGLQQRPD
ncbi:MAG: DUF1284 domain-containing protein [Chloroflexi bacterium]|nr:DUF1284 domain-containing protein [Chloroflexota bacterium]